MGQTVIQSFGSGNKLAQKKWSSALFVEYAKKSYFSKKFVGDSSNSIIQRKRELESDAGDEVSFDLAIELRGDVVTGDNNLEGNEEDMKFYTDQIRIDQMRKSVSIGGRMTRKRTPHNLRTNGKELLARYWSQFHDEMHFIYLSGARGINKGFRQPDNWTGHANNPIQPPDDTHILFGGTAVSKATLTAADKMSKSLIERAETYATMLKEVDPSQVSMMPVTIEGEPHYVCIMSPLQEHDLRTADATGWMEIQKAAASAEGRNNPIFKGGLGMIKDVVLHKHVNAIRFSDYGAGANVPAARALFLGCQAGVVAYGGKNGSFDWQEEVKDFGNKPIIASGIIMGVKKTRFNGRDFGVLALDTAAAPVS